MTYVLIFVGILLLVVSRKIKAPDKPIPKYRTFFSKKKWVTRVAAVLCILVGLYIEGQATKNGEEITMFDKRTGSPSQAAGPKAVSPVKAPDKVVVKDTNTFQPRELVAIRAEILSLRQRYEKALSENNLGLQHATNDTAQGLINRLDSIVGKDIMSHPASSCRMSAIMLKSWASLRWITEHSSASTDRDRRVDGSNYKDYQDSMAKCTESANNQPK